MDIHERKPCWHCKSVDTVNHEGEGKWFVICHGCWSMGPNGATAEESEEKWNTRPYETPGHCRDCENWRRGACDSVPGDHFCADFTTRTGKFEDKFYNGEEATDENQ